MKEVCVLAFAEPPPQWGFKRSRAGTSWYIRLAAERAPDCLAALKQRRIRSFTTWAALQACRRHPSSNWWREFWRELGRREIWELSPEEWRVAQYLGSPANRDRIRPESAVWLIVLKRGSSQTARLGGAPRSNSRHRLSSQTAHRSDTSRGGLADAR